MSSGATAGLCLLASSLRGQESGSEEREGPTEECALALNLGVDSAVHTITKWHKSAKAGLTFV